MNYIELINQFWRMDAERPFQPSDTRLYFYLLHTCNALGWKNPFGHSDRHLASQVGVVVNTIRSAKKRLADVGLIEITTPEKPSIGIAGQCSYKLLTVSKIDTVPDTAPDTAYDTVPDTNNKLNKTKPNLSISDEIKSEFADFETDVKNNYPNVAKLEKQITLNQYNTLRTELQLTPEQITNILRRMDNYKPLLKNYVSVYLTLRQWYDRGANINPSNTTLDLPKHYGR